MKQEQIINALECWSKNFDGKVTDFATLCQAILLIIELTEDNDRLKAENAEQDEAIIKALQRRGEVRRETQADTVRKMQERIIEKSCAFRMVNGEGIVLKTDYQISGESLDQIVKEMLEETDEQT